MAAPIEAGSRVRLEGLKGAAHLNGQEASVVSYVADSGRWIVELSGGEQKSLKPENLIVVKPAARGNTGKARGDGRSIPARTKTDDEIVKTREPEDDADSEKAGRMASDQDSGFVLCPSLAAAEQAISDGERRLEFGLTNAGPCVDFACRLLADADSKLNGLSFAACDLSAEMLQQLAAALAGVGLSLRAFGVSKNPGLAPATWRALFEALPQHLTWLDFGDDQLGDEGLSPLLQRLPGREDLDRLYLDGNSLKDVDMLCKALPDTGVTQLDLGDNELDEFCAKQLSHTLPKTVVMVLILGQNPISASGCRSIVEGLARTSIDTLYLNNTDADDECLQALAIIAEEAKVSELHLDSSKITDGGVRKLLPHLGGSQLNYVDISGNDVTDETAELLSKVLVVSISNDMD